MTAIPLDGEPRFPLGRVLATPGALCSLGDDEEQKSVALARLLQRHASGDWGEVCADDQQANEDALKYGARLLSAYTVRDTKFWIITEADRSATTLLLPHEY